MFSARKEECIPASGTLRLLSPPLENKPIPVLCGSLYAKPVEICTDLRGIIHFAVHDTAFLILM